MAAFSTWLFKGGWRVVGAGAGLAALISAGAGSVLHAQDAIPGSLTNFTGTVVDATHAPVPNVAVVVEDLGRGATHRYQTDVQGRFEAAELPAGDYEVEVAIAGFALFREPVLLVGPLVERELVLAVGPLEETITVGDGASRPGSEVRREPAPEPCVVPTDATTLSPIGGRLRPPRMLSRTTPIFPEHLQQDGVDGTVQLEGRIDPTGAVESLVVVEASHPDFAAAAEDAVRAWTWEQTLLNCTPVEVPITVHVRFVAED